MPEWACRFPGVHPVLSGPRTLMPPPSSFQIAQPARAGSPVPRAHRSQRKSHSNKVDRTDLAADETSHHRNRTHRLA
jgi:hypothetical protein